MINPADIPDAFGPFFKALDTIQENIAAIIPKAGDQPTRELFAGILAELKSKQTEFAVIGPQAVADGVARTNAALVKLAVLKEKKNTLVAEIQDVLAKSAVFRAEAEAKLAVLKAQPKKEPAQPRKVPGKKKVEVHLSSGKVLHDLLMGRINAPGRKALGNIWENWPSK